MDHVKILAIDDNADNLVVLKALLVEAFPKASFISALSGKMGLELCRSEKPDVILLDILMPEMDGYEVCQILKADDRTNTIPVVMITAARTDKESRIKALECGADAFLTKPVDESELTAQIRAMVRIKKSVDFKLNEKEKLKWLVEERTIQLEAELSERKRTEKALKQSKEKYSILFKNSPDSYLIISEGIFIDCNKSAEFMLKGDRTQIIGQTPDSISPEFQPDGKKSSESAAEKIAWTFEYGKNTFEWMHRRFDGTDLYVEVSLASMILKGKPTLFTTWRDISARKLTEQALKESEAQFREFFEKAADAIFIADTATGIIVDVNEAACRLMLRSYDELIGIHQSELHPPVMKKFAKETFKKHKELVTQRASSHPFENTVLRADGTQVPVEILASKVIFQGKNCLMGTFRDITERKKSEEALLTSEANLYAIVENTIESIWSINTNYEILHINNVFVQAFYNSFGVRLAKGSNIVDAIPKGLKEIWKDRYDRAFKNEHFVFEDRVDLGPNFIYIEVAMNPIVIDGIVVGASFFGRDVTEQKRAVEAIRISEARLKRAEIAARSGNWELYLDSQIMIGSEGATKLYGVKKDQFEFGVIKTIPLPEYRPLLDEALKNLVEMNTPYDIEFKIKTVDTNEIKDIHSEAVYDQEKRVLFGIIQDVTDQKKMEKELIVAKENAERSEKELILKNIELTEKNSFIQTVLNQLPIGIALNKINEGNTTYMNKKFEEIYGWTREEINSIASFFDHVYPDVEYRNQVMNQILDDMQSGETERMHWENIFITRKDGSKRVVNAVNIPLIDQNTMVSTVSDITALHKSQNDLLVAKEKAEENDRLKSAFLANMSHEIRTPLNSIIGFSELLFNPDFDIESQKQFAQMINSSGTNLLAIISDIMDLSKIEAGQIQVNKSRFLVNKLISDIQKEYSYKASEKGIELRIDPASPAVETFLESDQNRIKQVLVNFVGNSIKFTAKGSIEIGFKLVEGFIQFHVFDTGIGIPKEYHDFVFERFRQVDSSSTRKYGGNGLGLAISKSLVELFGGRIWMESEPGKGSAFYFTIPVQTPETGVS